MVKQSLARKSTLAAAEFAIQTLLKERVQRVNLLDAAHICNDTLNDTRNEPENADQLPDNILISA